MVLKMIRKEIPTKIIVNDKPAFLIKLVNLTRVSKIAAVVAGVATVFLIFK